MLPPFQLRPLDYQLCIVELHSGSPPGVDAAVCESLIRHRRVIEALRRGVSNKQWDESCIPHCAKTLDGIKGLERLSPSKAAELVAQQMRKDGHIYEESKKNIQKRVYLSNCRDDIVSCLRKRARLV